MKRYDDVSIILYDYDYDAGDDSILSVEASYTQIMIMNITIGSYVDGWMNGNENDAHDSMK